MLHSALKPMYLLPFLILLLLGHWKELAPIPDITLESLAANIEGEDKKGFLRWLRAALQWNAKDQPSVTDLLFDE